MRRVVSTILTVIFALFLNWAVCPAWTIRSEGAWFTVFLVLGFYALCNFAADIFADEESIFTGITAAIAGVVLVLLLVLCFFSSRLVLSGTYQRQFSVTETDFAEDMAEENISSLALMDSESAAIYGKRVLGELPAEFVSVYDNSETYSTISYQGKPMKVSALQFAGVFKAMQNENVGVPAYVIVDPVNYTAEYVVTEKPMKYVPSGVFGHKLRRHIHNAYPTYIQGNTFFEIDEEGNPYYITQHMSAQAGVFGCKNVVGIFVTNPCDGKIDYYTVNECPDWIDIVYDGKYIETKYNDYGQYKQGFWNAYIGQQGCTVTTDDFGYKVIGSDVYIYTGITSKAADESNVGFILVNGRTMEAKYYSVVGAEEYSAMGAAEGEVQQYGYKGSFPSLINVEGQPTYVLVLKDANGIVKKMAMVNVEHYDVVAVEDNLNKVRSSYLKLLASRGVTDKSVSDDLRTINASIVDVEFVTVEGNTVVYLKTDKGVFKADFDESYILLNANDNVSISYYKSGQPIEYVDSLK